MRRAAYTYAVAATFVAVGIIAAILIPRMRAIGPFSVCINPRVVCNVFAPVYFNHHVALRIAVALLGIALAITVIAVGTRQRRRSQSN